MIRGEKEGEEIKENKLKKTKNIWKESNYFLAVVSVHILRRKIFATPQITGLFLMILVSRCGDTIHSFIEMRNLNKITHTFTFSEFFTCPLAKCFHHNHRFHSPLYTAYSTANRAGKALGFYLVILREYSIQLSARQSVSICLLSLSHDTYIKEI